MKIQPWNIQLELTHGGGIVTSDTIQITMQSEIDALRTQTEGLVYNISRLLMRVRTDDNAAQAVVKYLQEQCLYAKDPQCPGK